MQLITDEKGTCGCVDMMTGSAGVFVYWCTERGHFVRANAQADIYELVLEWLGPDVTGFCVEVNEAHLLRGNAWIKGYRHNAS